MMRARATGPGFVVLALVALVAVAVVLAIRARPSRVTMVASAAPTASERFPNAWPTPPPPDVAALLGGLGPGSELTGAWRVRGVSPVEQGRIVIDVVRDEVGFRVWIVQKGKDDRLPPRQTRLYWLYTAQPRPSAEALGDEDYAPVLDALVARIRSAESTVPVPAGM
jgi:hypothetical protein